MLKRGVYSFTILMVINPLLIVSFQNCTKPQQRLIASNSKEIKKAIVKSKVNDELKSPDFSREH